MEVTKRKPERLAMTFDELSVERSKNFVKAMQELKNLRPQLYSAAEYCEKSYLHSEQKQMVLDNLKDYAARALVNAVDHLGTVAYKLTDLLEQQTLDVSTMELKATCINQQLLTCQTFMDKEGLRQQQLLAIIPRHHRRYIFPNLVNKEVHFSSHVRTDPGRIHAQARPCVHPSGASDPQLKMLQLYHLAYFILYYMGLTSYVLCNYQGSRASKTLSWHLASETKPILKGTQTSSMSSEVQKTYIKSSGTFYLLDDDGSMRAKSSPAHPQLPRGNPAYGVVMQPFGVTHRDSSAGSRPTTPFRSFENPGQHAVVPAPSRSSRGMLLSFFVKQRTPKLKAGPAS